MEATFVKINGGFFPDNAQAEKLFKRVPEGESAMVTHIRKRNYENHKRFFKLRDVTFEIQDKFIDDEIWRKHVEMLGGHYEQVIVPMPPQAQKLIPYLETHLGGPIPDKVIQWVVDSYGVQFWPKSIKFEEMEEGDFQALFDRCITAFLDRYGGGMTENEFYQVLEFDG